MPAPTNNGSTEVNTKYVPPAARHRGGIDSARRGENARPKGHGHGYSPPKKYGGYDRPIPDWSTDEAVKPKPRAPLMTMTNFPTLGGGGIGGSHARDLVKPAPVVPIQAPIATSPATPIATSPTQAQIISKTESEAGTSSSHGVQSDQDQKEYQGNGNMESVLSRLLGRAGRHPASERDLLLYISTESKGRGYLAHYLYDGKFFSEEHMDDVLYLLSDRFERDDFLGGVISYDWKRVDCQSAPHPFLESKQTDCSLAEVTTKVTICTVWFEQLGKAGRRAFMEDICEELEKPIISLHRKHRLYHAGQDNVTEEEVRAPRVILKTRMPGVSPTGLPR